MKNNYNISQEKFEQIERYILMNMYGKELTDFKKELKTNKQLQQKVEEYRIIITGIEEQSFLNKLDKFHTDLNPTKTITETPKIFSFTKYAITASITLIIGFGIYWFYNSSNSNQRLYTKYFKPDPGLPTVMSTTNNYNFYDAMVNYKRENYKLAIKKWEELLKKEPHNDTLNYFLGVAHLANNNQTQSIKYLKNVIKNKNTNFKDDAYYYLGLAYLKKGNTNLAKKNIKLSNNKSKKDILEKLEKR